MTDSCVGLSRAASRDVAYREGRVKRDIGTTGCAVSLPPFLTPRHQGRGGLLLAARPACQRAVNDRGRLPLANSDAKHHMRAPATKRAAVAGVILAVVRCVAGPGAAARRVAWLRAGQGRFVCAFLPC